jgi:hypothetical protein
MTAKYPIGRSSRHPSSGVRKRRAQASRTVSLLLLAFFGSVWAGCGLKKPSAALPEVADAPAFTEERQSGGETEAAEAQIDVEDHLPGPPRCRPLGAEKSPSYEVCWELRRGADGDDLVLVVRDSETPDDRSRHELVTETAIMKWPNDWNPAFRWNVFPVTEGSLIWAPLWRDLGGDVDEGRIVLYLYDADSRTLSLLSDRLECPADCFLQALTFLSRDGKVTIAHEFESDGQRAYSTYTLGPDGTLNARNMEKKRSEAELAKGRPVPPFKPVCQRTAQVREAIEKRVSPKKCGEISREDLAKVRRLDLQGRGVKRLRAGDFSGMPNLNRIDLGDNPLSVLPRGVFNGLFKLTYLSLSDCRLREIPPAVFEDLHSLRTLYLNGNRIGRLRPDSFAGLSSVTFLALNKNRIRALPPEVFVPLERLDRPYLSGNPLKNWKGRESPVGSWFAISVVTESGTPAGGTAYRLRLSNGKVISGTASPEGDILVGDLPADGGIGLSVLKADGSWSR